VSYLHSPTESERGKIFLHVTAHNFFSLHDIQQNSSGELVRCFNCHYRNYLLVEENFFLWEWKEGGFNLLGVAAGWTWHLWELEHLFLKWNFKSDWSEGILGWFKLVHGVFSLAETGQCLNVFDHQFIELTQAGSSYFCAF
jgi:hypothetical protein